MTVEQHVTAEASVTSKNLSKVALLRLAQYPFIALFAFLVPRLMGPDSYGRYALFVSLVGIISSFLDLGITEISAREVPRLERQRDRHGVRIFFSRMLAFKGSLDLGLITLSALVLWLFRPPVVAAPAYAWALLLAVLVADLNGTAYGLLFGLNKPALCSARDPLRRAASLVSVLLLFRMLGLRGAIFSVVIVESSLALLYLAWTRRYVSIRELKPNWAYTAPLLRYGLLFYLSWSITNVWQRLGNTLISYLHGNFQQVALFDLSNQIFLTATGFTAFLISALAPMFTRLRLDNKEPKLIDWSRRILTYSQIGCTAALAAWLLLGPDLIPILIGRQYGGLYLNTALLLLGLFPMVIVQLGLTLAMAYTEPLWYLLALVAALGSFVIAALVLVAAHGAIGCSAAMLLSCFLCAVTIGLRYRDNLRRSVGPGLKAIAIGLCILAPCWLWRGPWMRNVALLLTFLCVYGGALAITRIIDAQEMRQAWQALRHPAAS